MLTQARLKELIDYDPETGEFTHRQSRGGSREGDRAGSLDPLGYWKIGVGGVQIRAHRLAWLYVHGVMPSRIDHIDMNRRNNRIGNLRIASRSENAANGGAHVDNKCGLKGVSYLPNRKKPWRATIMCRGKWKFLGYRATAEEAHALYVAAAKEAFGEFARAA